MYLLVNLLASLAICATTTAIDVSAPSTPPSPIQSRNKTKRTIGDLQNYGDSKPVLFLVDNVGASSSNIPTFYTSPKALVLKPVFEPEVPKQVAAQQVLYEFQQTPTNAVSNVHVNQLFQPFDFAKDSTAHHSNGPSFTTEAPPPRLTYSRATVPPTGGGVQTIQTSESIASPVQHAALINHGQNYAHVQFQPTLPTPVGAPQHIQTHHYIPGKYLYVNGKIIYQPTPVGQGAQAPPNPYAQQQNYHPQGHHQGFGQGGLGSTAPQTYGGQGHHANANHLHLNKRPPVSFITYHNTPRLPKQNLTPPPRPSAPPAAAYQANTKFQPPVRLQQITKPMSSPAPVADREEEESEEDDKAAVRDDEEEVEEGDDEEDEPKARYKQEEEDDEERYYEDRPSRYYERYRYNDDDDEEDDHKRYRKPEEEAEEEEEDEDSHEGSSRIVPTKVKKHPRGRSSGKRHGKSPKYHKSKDYKYSESYGSKSEYETPSKRSKKGKGKGKNKPGYYKTVKYTKHSNGKPKIETIEGRQSQLVPVVEKRKVFQESWVVSKSTDAAAA